MDLVIVILICSFPLLGLIWVEFETNRQEKKRALKGLITDLLIFGQRCNFLTMTEVRQLEALIDREVDSVEELRKLHRFTLNCIFEEIARQAHAKTKQDFEAKQEKKPSDNLHPVQKILGLGKDFTQDELKKSYRKWMMTNHPDKNPNADTDLVQQVTAWYNQRKVK